MIISSLSLWLIPLVWVCGALGREPHLLARRRTSILENGSTEKKQGGNNANEGSEGNVDIQSFEDSEVSSHLQYSKLYGHSMVRQMLQLIFFRALQSTISRSSRSIERFLTGVLIGF